MAIYRNFGLFIQALKIECRESGGQPTTSFKISSHFFVQELRIPVWGNAFLSILALRELCTLMFVIILFTCKVSGQLFLRKICR